jgi:hypothetical protein
MSRVAAWPRLLLAGVALLGVGMVLVVSGVRVGPLFIPGVVVLGLGFLLLAGAGIIASLPERADDGVENG